MAREARDKTSTLLLDKVKPKPRSRKVKSWKGFGDFPLKEVHEKAVAKHGKDSKQAKACLTDRVTDVLKRLRTLKVASKELTEAQAEMQLTEKEAQVIAGQGYLYSF